MKSWTILVLCFLVAVLDTNYSFAKGVCNSNIEIPSGPSKTKEAKTSDFVKATWIAKVHKSIDERIDLISNATNLQDIPLDNKVTINILKGNLIETEIVQKSDNPTFDLICIAVLGSLKDDPTIDLQNEIDIDPSKVVLSFKHKPTKFAQERNDFSVEQIQSLAKLSLPKLKEHLSFKKNDNNSAK